MKRSCCFIASLCLVLQAFSQPATNASDSADFYLQKGLQQKKEGRRMESLKFFEKAAKYDASNKTVLTELASANFDLRRYHQSKDNYKKLVELGDASPANLRQLLQLSFNLRQPDDVVLYAAQLKKADPAEKISYYVGKVEYDRGNYGEALRHLDLASKEDPANAEVPYMVARSYADMQNYKQCIPFFQKAIALDTAKANWYYELSLIYYAVHDDKNALKCMLKAGEKGYKKDDEYYENLGIAYLNAGDLEQGAAMLGEILKKRPSDINILNMMAEAFYYKGKYQQAMDFWDQILYYDKQNAAALYMIGMCYHKKGEKEKGQRLCDKAIEMDPSLASLKQKKQMPGGL